jgi:uncharacterized LabA/DUF88 family protein
MRTIAYVDGFNLYYRLLKKRPDLRWLNPRQLIEEFMPRDHELVQVNYYTARISERSEKPGAAARQAIYLKALSTIPRLKIHQGNFLTSKTWMALSAPPRARPEPYQWTEPAPKLVRVIKSEEKGSDVNIAAHLVRDAFINAFDTALVLTNDSDLVEPIRIAIREVGKKVGLLAPVESPTRSLTEVASFCLHVRPGHLLRAQFPEKIDTPEGRPILRPEKWQVTADS